MPVIRINIASRGENGTASAGLTIRLDNLKPTIILTESAIFSNFVQGSFGLLLLNGVDQNQLL